MQERLDRTCTLPLGTRDAVHVPIVVAEHSDYDTELTSGAFVKFTDSTYTKFVTCDKSEAHGILNPFLDTISSYAPVIVLLMPGITTPVRHQFTIDPQQKAFEDATLRSELEERQKEDPTCASCWVIENGEIIRY